MIDPLTHGPMLDVMMGGLRSPASKIFEELRRQADQKARQFQAENPGAPPPQIDYSALAEKASEMAASEGAPGGAQGMAPGETAGMPDAPRGWGGIGRTFQGESIPADAARTARFKGLTDAGIALLGSAGEGNIGRGLAQGLSAFQGGMGSELEGFTARRRQSELDELRKRQVEESMGASREARNRARAAEGRDVASFKEKQRDREGVLSAMDEQVRAIEELAGADSPEADRAHALRRGGPALQDDLDKLHQQLIARKRFPEDQAMETDAEIAKRKRVFSEDPQARYERGIESRRVGAYEESLKDRGHVTPQQMNDDIRAEASLIYTALKDRAEAARKAAVDDVNADPTKPPPPIDYVRLMDEARSQAEATVRQRYQGLGGSAPAGSNDDAILATAKAALARRPDMSTEELRWRLLKEVGGDEKRAERLLVMLSGM